MDSDYLKAEESRLKDVYAQREVDVPTDRYSCLKAGNVLIVHEIESHLLSMLRPFGPDFVRRAKILDMGCGSGRWLRAFVNWGARPQNLFGIDLIRERVEEARNTLPSAVTVECGNAATILHADQTFDLVLQFTMFSSILSPEIRESIAREMLRVLKPRGHVVWYDLRVDNPLNRNVRGLDKNALRKLFPGCSMRLRRITLLPPLARAIGDWSSIPYRVAAGLKILSTHYLGVIEKTSDALSQSTG